MTDDLITKGLIKAIRDLKTAEQLLSISKNDLYTDTICFNSQQSVEKLLKCYLSSRSISYPRTHNLKFLHHLCIKDDPEFEHINVDGLTIYAVDTRYPESFYIPNITEAGQAIESARKIKNFVLKKLNKEESNLTLF